MTEQQKEALRLLGVYTARRYDVWLLMGSGKASCRAHIMSALHGKNMPQSKSGVNALRDAFYGMCNPQGECDAVREDNFIQWAKSQE